MCRYTFINQKQDQTIVSIKRSTDDQRANDNEDDETVAKRPRVFTFNHEKEYTLTLTENFLSTCLENAISIEVWYQYSSIPLSVGPSASQERTRRDAEIRALSNRWKEVKRYIQYAVEIHELDASGRWEPVEVDASQPQIISGGVYRLRQVRSFSLSSSTHDGVFSGPIETTGRSSTRHSPIGNDAVSSARDSIGGNRFDQYAKDQCT